MTENTHATEPESAPVRAITSSRHPIAVRRGGLPVVVPPAQDETGFTLIELLVVVVILPLVIGGIAVALLSVFGLQNQTTNRITDSNDEQIASVNFNRDVQSADS